MFSKIKFKSGSSPEAACTEVNPAPINVFVGPNNSGKSKALTELESLSNNSEDNASIIIDQVLFSGLTEQEIMQEIELLKPYIDSTNPQGDMHFIHSAKRQSVSLRLDNIISAAVNPLPNAGLDSYTYIRRFLTLRLDGRTRLNLLNEVNAVDLQNPRIENALDIIFRNNDLRNRVRNVIYEAIGKYFVIDPTNMGKLRVRFSDRAPISESEERGFTDASVAFHGAADSISKVSDGVNAFAGIITALVAGNPRIILIDEPEAFLHPALAMKLGKEIGRSIDNRKQVFVATHSAAFIMGCIQSGSPINIIRFTYKNGTASTRVLERSKLLHLMRNPMLRSTGILDGLFYEAVIVTEADADRAFYQEINERLHTTGDGRGIGNCLFVNAQGKHTVWDIVKPLRELGIPAIGLIDLDMVKDQGGVFAKIITGASIPIIHQQAMTTFRGSLLRALDAADPNWKRSGGIQCLPPSEQQAANDYFDQLELYGVFVVRSGEVESWLRGLNSDIPTNKTQWLRKIFERMGEDPADANYVHPNTGDVWGFVGRMQQWANNPTRLGIPQ